MRCTVQAITSCFEDDQVLGGPRRRRERQNPSTTGSVSGVRLELTVRLVACQGGETALINAASCGNLAAVVYLVEHSASVNVKDNI
jgi:hypothetical protein